jgi:putative membrane protein
MRVEELFDEKAFATIEHAVREAEQGTSGEIVPAVVDQSHDYTGVRAVAASVLAFAVAVLLLATPLDPVLWLPPAQLLSFAAGYWLAGRRALLRQLIPASARVQATDRGARLAFVEHGLVDTRDRTGILIYVSLLEHRVVVLADRGIDSAVEAGTWDGIVERVLGGIREGRAEEGFADAIRHCGELLAERFPPRPDDTNELANRLRS